MKRVAVLGVVALLACTHPPKTETPEAPVPEVTCKLHVDRTEFHADTAFLPSEREAVARAFDHLHQLSDGHIRLSVVYDVDFESTPSVVANAFRPMLIRRLSWQKPVIAIDQHFRGHVLGWTSYEPKPRVQLVVDRLEPPASLEWVTAHELGHALEFAGRADEQHHTSDPESVMAARHVGQRAWKPEDREACRAACLCR